jgi:hypothetical protein
MCAFISERGRVHSPELYAKRFDRCHSQYEFDMNRSGDYKAPALPNGPDEVQINGPPTTHRCYRKEQTHCRVRHSSRFYFIFNRAVAITDKPGQWKMRKIHTYRGIFAYFL